VGTLPYSADARVRLTRETRPLRYQLNTMKTEKTLRDVITTYLAQDGKKEADFNIFNYGDQGTLQLTLCLNPKSARLVKIWDCIKTMKVGFEVRSVTCEDYYHIDVSEILDSNDAFDVADILIMKAQEKAPIAQNKKLMDYIHGRVVLSEAFKPLLAQTYSPTRT
jgi:hypothetical protein